ncbi:MAG: type II toxin-antitoxin system RelE/ParE family toxin [Chitinispirillales bacterium]|jgi:mRNA interferase RelE/StbE|nr:type II toxin-antitoxin system RelE/ParE family toxin [Chitinispirillales bacterium]
MYRIEWTKKFEKQLEKLGENAAKQILKYLHHNIDGTDNPRVIGKELKGNRKGQWRYRTGNYRIICEIQDEKLIVLALETGNRKNIYRTM